MSRASTSRNCSLCSGKLWGRSILHNGLPAHVLCAKPIVLCETCGAEMPRSGPARRRNGKVTCTTCVPDRKGHVRKTRGAQSMTAATKHLTQELLRSHAALLSEADFAALSSRPRTWGECCERTGPCAFVSCKYHLYLDVSPESGSIKFNFPLLEPEELQNPCTLRIASTGGVTLEEVGVSMNLTRERVRQLEVRALLQLKREARRL